jgi:hypothetical protein
MRLPLLSLLLLNGECYAQTIWDVVSIRNPLPPNTRHFDRLSHDAKRLMNPTVGNNLEQKLSFHVSQTIWN